MEAKKKVLLYRVMTVLLLSAVIFLIAFPVVKVLNSQYRVIIKDKDMNYYRAGNVFICGNTLICKRDSEPVKERSLLPEEKQVRVLFQNTVDAEYYQHRDFTG